MKLKLGDVLVLKDDRGRRKAGEMIQVDETAEKGLSGEIYWLSFEANDKWWAQHYFRKATDREAFLYHLRGQKALIKEEQ